MRALFTFLFVSLLTACATGVGFYLDKAEKAIDDQKWESAYRFLEDGLVSPDKKIKARAIALYKKHPQVRVGAANSFSYESLNKHTLSRSFTFAVPRERERLRMYTVVATNEELQVASENYQRFLDDYAAYQADAKAKAEALKEKEAAELKALYDAFDRSKANAVFACKDRLECEKAFSLTQIFIATNSDMKIQMANDTIIQTHNPLEAQRWVQRLSKSQQRVRLQRFA